jgi:hypothetical protein
MNLRLSPKTTRIRLTREELASLTSTGSLETVLAFCGEVKLRMQVRTVQSSGARCFASNVGGDLTMSFELSGSDVVQLAVGEVATADGGAVLEVDAFSGKRRLGKEKKYESVLKTDHLD